MKVVQLAKFLDGIVLSLDGIVSAPTTKEIKSFTEALEQFGNSTVVEFTSFLGQFGLEFQRTGTITAQGKISLNKATKAPKQDATEQVATAVAKIKDLFGEIDSGSVDENRLNQVLEPISKLTVTQLHQVLAGLEIAEKPRAKPKIIEKIKQVVRHQMESRARSATTVPFESTS